MSRRNQLRIIGGTHRSRLVTFPEHDGLRPTGDRVRETIFNWLQMSIVGARCLDLFAGSGVLGFEALSRGAASVTLLDSDAKVVANLHKNSEQLGFDQARIERINASDWLTQSSHDGQFDIAFLDPPFADEILYETCRQLQQSGALKAGAKVYLEHELPLAEEKLPVEWEAIKKKAAGKVHFGLFLANHEAVYAGPNAGKNSGNFK